MPMLSRAEALQAITVGDLIFGLRDDGWTDMLLVCSADATTILARNVLNRTTISFGRDGEGSRVEDGRACTIVSTARLPAEQYQVAIGLDRRMGSNPEYPDTRLTEEEIKLILSYEEFFETRLLPGMESVVTRARKLRAVSGILVGEWDPANAAENPPSRSEYDDYVPALVDLLEGQISTSKVAGFLAEMAARRGRPPRGAERDHAAAASLMRLRQDWS